VREAEVLLPSKVAASNVEHTVNRICAETALHVSLRGTLARYPGSLHWHLKRGSERGTLEITFDPGTTRLWLSVHARREADWIDEILSSLPQLIVQELARVPAAEKRRQASQ